MAFADHRAPLVLLAEDEPATAEMYRLGLEQAGFRVRIAAEVSIVFATIEEEPPDAVVLDYHLGGIITGVDILDNLRLDGRTELVPALILSNHSGDLDGQIDRAFRAGACAWLLKHQTDPVQLAIHVRDAVAGRCPAGASSEASSDTAEGQSSA